MGCFRVNGLRAVGWCGLLMTGALLEAQAAGRFVADGAPADARQTGAASAAATGGTAAAAPDAAVSLPAVRRLIDSGRAAAALDALDALAKQQPVPAGVERTRGLAFYALGRLPEAEAAFGRAMVMDPADGEAAQMRGLALFRLGRPAAAIPLLEQSHGFGPQMKADPSYVLALCYLDTLRYDDARRAFAAQFGVDAESAAGYLLTARMLLRREYVPVAQEYAERALKLEAGLPLAHELLGEIALASSHGEVAIAEFEKERQRNPAEGVSYERLGDAYSRAARYREATRVLQQAVLLEPNSTGPYILLGKVMLKQGDLVGAATFLEKAERMDPANFMTHSLLAQAYRGLGRTAEAGRELELTEKSQAADEPKAAAPQ